MTWIDFRAAGKAGYRRIARWGIDRRQRLGFMLIFVGVVVFLAVGIHRSAPRSMVALSAQSETLENKVVSAAASSIALPRATTMLSAATCVRDIVIRPAPDSVVIYTRPRGGPLTVAVRGPVTWTGTLPEESESFHTETDGVQFALMRDKETPSSESCDAGSVRIVLPIHGPAVFGEVLQNVTSSDSPQYVLLSGKVQVSGRAISQFFGISVFDKGPFRANALYQPQELVIPGGSRIGRPLAYGGVNKDAKAQPVPSNWSGFAYVDFDDESSRAIAVEASSSAESIEVFSPEAPDAKGGELPPDIIALSVGARLAHDPNLAWLGGLIAILASVLAFSGVFNFKKEDKP